MHTVVNGTLHVVIVGCWMMLISKIFLIKFILLVGVVEAVKSSRRLLLFIGFGGLTFLKLHRFNILFLTHSLRVGLSISITGLFSLAS